MADIKRVIQTSNRWAYILTEYELEDEASGGGEVMLEFRVDVANGRITKRDLTQMCGISFRALALARRELGKEKFEEMLMADDRSGPENN